MVDRATTTEPAHTVSPDVAEGQVTFTLDGRQVTARKGEMLIAAAERAGTFIPRFCYHPRMKSVGVCRMCLVEVSGPRGASLQPSCFVEVAEGSEVTTDSDKVKKAQDGVLEFLLINHPLDCPVCDKGGECPLQDQTLAHGPGETRFVEEKRHFEKPIPISELVLLDRERCIQCSRCTRFAAEVAGEAQIDFIGRADQLEINIFPDLPFASYFSGNTVQICPVGRSPPSPTGSPPGPGTSTRWSRPAPPVRWGAGWWRSRHAAFDPLHLSARRRRSEYESWICASKATSSRAPST